MATTTITQVFDDIDGSPDASTVAFGFQGVGYSIDLAPANAERLMQALEPFIVKAVRVRTPAAAGNGHSRNSANGNGANRAYDIASLREWAARANVELPQRGRIPGAVVEQYREAGGQ